MSIALSSSRSCVVDSLNVTNRTAELKPLRLKRIRLRYFTARSSYASAVLGMVILSVRPSVWITLDINRKRLKLRAVSAFLCRFSPNLTQRCKLSKVKTSSLRVNIASPLPLFPRKNRHFWPRGPKNPGKYEKRNICLKYSRIAKIPAFYRKSGSGNTMARSDFWQKVEIWPFRACAMKNMQFGPYSWPNRLWTRLWGRYYIPQNVFVVFLFFKVFSFSFWKVFRIILNGCTANKCRISHKKTKAYYETESNEKRINVKKHTSVIDSHIENWNSEFSCGARRRCDDVLYN